MTDESKWILDVVFHTLAEGRGRRSSGNLNLFLQLIIQATQKLFTTIEERILEIIACVCGNKNRFFFSI